MTRKFAKKLVQRLSGSRLDLLRGAASLAESMNMPLYAVGGLPRDLALGRTPTDCDLVVEGSAIDLARALLTRYGGEITTHRKFGTANWRVAQARMPLMANPAASGGRATWSELDLISARDEDYPRPAQLPRVRFGTIEQDLERRDFIMNALAIRLDGHYFGEVLDPLEALRDIRQGVIRVLHADSFRDDPTRMYRAVRYEQRLGFRISPETLRLMPPARRWVGELSPHRVRQELNQILRERQGAATLGRLESLGLLRAIHPALPGTGPAMKRLRTMSSARAVKAATPNEARIGHMEWLMWLLDLTPAQIQSLNQRLHFDGQLLEELMAAAKLRRRMTTLTRLRASKISRELGKLPLRSVEAVSSALPPGIGKKILRQYLTRWRHVRPRTTGADLRELGIPAGPVYRTILQDLQTGWIDGTIRTPEAERLQVEKYVAKLQRGAASRRGPAGKRSAR